MMSSEVTPAQSRPIRALLVDQDPAFRLGLRLMFEPSSDIQIVAESASAAAALAALEQRALLSPDLMLELMIVDVRLGANQPDQMQGLGLCQAVRSQYPTLPILMLGSLSEPVLIAAAQQAGATGYCAKESDPRRLSSIVRRVALGRPYWPAPSSSLATSTESDRVLPQVRQRSQPGSFAAARRNLRRSGLAQIDAAIADMTQQLRNLDLTLLERAVLAGRRRELRAARWVVRQLLATPDLSDDVPSEPQLSSSSAQPSSSSPQPSPGPLVPAVTQLQTTARDVQQIIIDSVLAKLAMGVQNQTAQPLEIDILRDEKRRELLYTVVRRLEELLSELRYSQVEATQLADKRSLLLLDVWQGVVSDFFGKYYTLSLGGVDVEVVSVLLQDVANVQREILDKIPFVPELLSHLLYQVPLMVNGRACATGNPEAMARAELILENLIIQVGNAAIQPLLNRFADHESVKQGFYDYRILSTRDIERFRNDLSWNYRMARLFTEPKNMFESQHSLLTIYGRSIKQVFVYAPRKQELETLSGLPYVVTLALETRDAIAPRLRSAVSVVGSGVIYVLTDVVGRAIGLIGRGILKGLGTAWQEGRYNRR